MQEIPSQRPTLDPMDPYRAIVSGWYDCGHYALFVPEGSTLVQPTVFFAGIAVNELIHSGWMEEMRGIKANFVVLEKVDEESFSAVWNSLKERRLVNPYSSACYLVAMGKEGTCQASLLAAGHPEHFAGIALLGDGACISSLEKECAKRLAPEADHFLDSVPMPLWTDSQNSDAYQFWSKVNGCEAQGHEGLNETLRRPTEDRDLGADIMVSGKKDLSSILAFLFKKRRFPGLRDGNLRDAGLPESIGVLRHEAVFDGFKRYWYTYVPEHEEGALLPLVLVLHGRGGEGGEFIARSGWRQVSDEAGCITVYPTGASGPEKPITYWNFYDHGKTPLLADDLSFLSQLVDRLCGELPVDKDRIYLSGQSMGSMMSMAMSLAYPGKFAASASSAGLLPGFMEHLSQIEINPGVPLWVSLGEFDSLAGTCDPERNEAVKWFLGNLRTRYGAETPTTLKRGCDVDHVCRDKEGWEILRYTQVMGKTHAILPSEARLFWKWMRNYRRG